MLAWKLARRELRGGVRGLWIVLACLALGVAAITAVGTLRTGIERTLAAEGRTILGGDIEVLGDARPLPDALHIWLRDRGARLSDVVTLRSMLVAPASGERMLVELKAVDGAWPLVGAAAARPPMSMADALAGRGALVEQLALDRLKLAPGDSARLGETTVMVKGALTNEPDRVADPSIFGPRLLVSLATLQAAQLLQPGAFATHHLRAALPPGADVARVIADLRAAFPDTGWRIRDAHDAAPGVVQFVDRTTLFMTLVGLTSLLVGGIGVANGVRAWLQARARGIATLRCLGASGRLVFAVCLIQVMALALLGVLAGLVAGVTLPAAAVALFRGALPVVPQIGLFPRPLALAALYGVLVAASFALAPLARAMRIPGAALFRDDLQPASVPMDRLVLAANVALALALIGLTVASSGAPGFALGFCAAALATLALFRVGGSALMRVAAAVPASRRVWARLGIANLYRPGATTPLMLVSIGLGLSTLAAVALIQGNLRRQVAEQMPAHAPSFFFIDLQDAQLPRFRSILGGIKGVGAVSDVPSLRARMVAVKGVAVDRLKVTPDSAWALRGDRGLTYAGAMPADTRLVAGRWWPADYAGPPLVSFDANLAKGWGVGIGDVLRVNVLGRDIDLRIANLRDIAWRTLGINFTMVASPGLLAHAPHSNIATVRSTPAVEAQVLRAVTDALPNVSGIRVADVLAAVAKLLGQVAAALAATGSLTLVAGALVLAGAVASGQRRRIDEAVILKTLGATRGQIRTAWLVEFGVLGVVAGLLAAGVGTLASFGVLRYVMHADWSLLPGTLLGTILASLLIMLVFGFAGTEAALRVKPAPLLRND